MTKYTGDLYMELIDIINTELANLIAETSSYEFKKFIYSDERFCIGCSATYKEIHVWADDGNTALLAIEEVKDLTAASKDIYDAIIDWLNGFICCSDCGKRIKKSEIAGGYFAGRYCTDCWNNKWKAIESKETYE